MQTKTVEHAEDGSSRARGRPWKRWVAAVLLVLLGIAGGLAVHDQLPRTYSASATLLVLPTAGGLESSVSGSRTASDIQIETEAELASSAQVAIAASELLEGEMASEDLLRGSTISVPANSQVLVVTLDAPTPELARDGAMAISQAYLDRRGQEATDEIATVVESLEGQQADLTVRLEENAAELADISLVDTGARALAESQRNLLVDQLSDINSRLVALRFQTTSGGEIITAADLPSTASSPVLAINVGAGALLGALLAAALLLLLERRGRRYDLSPQDLPQLARVTLRDPGRTESGVLRTSSLQAAVLGRACAELEAFPSAGGPTAIVGLGDPELRMRLLQGFNHAWAGEHTDSLLVLTHEGDHQSLVGAPPAAPGLAELVNREIAVGDVATGVHGSPVSVLGAGRASVALSPSAQRARLRQTWGELLGRFGGVVIDVVPPFDSVWSQSVLQTSGRIVIAVQENLKDSDELAGVVEDLVWLGLGERIAGLIRFEAPTHEEHAPVASGERAPDQPVADSGTLVGDEPSTVGSGRPSGSSAVPGPAPRQVSGRGSALSASRAAGRPSTAGSDA